MYALFNMFKVKFSFWAFGILGVAALSMVLAFLLILSGRKDESSIYLLIASTIVMTFIFYMFIKLFMKG